MKINTSPLTAKADGIRLLEIGPGWASFLVEVPLDAENSQYVIARMGINDVAWIVRRGCSTFDGDNVRAELTLDNKYRLTFADTDAGPVAVPMHEPFRSLFALAVQQVAHKVLSLRDGGTLP